jgi:hypothetical protein
MNIKEKILQELKRRHSALVNPREWISINEISYLFSFYVITRMIEPEYVIDALKELIEDEIIVEKDDMQYFQLANYKDFIKEIEHQWKQKSKIKRSIVKKEYDDKRSCDL